MTDATIAVLIAFVVVLVALDRYELWLTKHGHRRRDW